MRECLARCRQPVVEDGLNRVAKPRYVLAMTKDGVLLLRRLVGRESLVGRRNGGNLDAAKIIERARWLVQIKHHAICHAAELSRYLAERQPLPLRWNRV